MRALRQPLHDATSSFGLPASGYRDLVTALADARRVLVYSGSGLSADSGLPTYRGVGEHLWTEDLLTRVATFEGFKANTAFAQAWYEEQAERLQAAQPHAGHAALAGFEALFEVTHVTQNVDRLLEQATCSRVLHIHGAYDSAQCLDCGKYWSDRRPHLTQPCPACNRGVLRPGIVLQGEPPPVPLMNAAYQLARQANFVLVVGTPAEMYPGAAIVETAHAANVPVCVVNPQWCENIYYARWQLYAGAQEALPTLLADVWRERAHRGQPLPWYLRWLRV